VERPLQRAKLLAKRCAAHAQMNIEGAIVGQFRLVYANVILTCLYSFGIALMPYAYIAQGDDLFSKLLDVGNSVADSFIYAQRAWLQAFFIPFLCGIGGIVCFSCLLVANWKGRTTSIILTDLAFTIIVTVWGSVLSRDLHIVFIANIPLFFAWLSARKMNNREQQLS
jgi:hypothetical protein